MYNSGMAYDAFRKWLNDYMQENNLTQESLGEKIGVAHPTVHSWLVGKHPPMPDSLRRLAEVSGADVLELFQMVEYLPTPIPGAGIQELRPKVRRIVALLDGMDDIMLDLISVQIRSVLLPYLSRLRERVGGGRGES